MSEEIFSFYGTFSVNHVIVIKNFVPKRSCNEPLCLEFTEKVTLQLPCFRSTV